MKILSIMLALALSPPVGADPCRRLLEVIHALDLRGIDSEYGLDTHGHLKIGTPILLSPDELAELFRSHPSFNAPNSEGRTRSMRFESSRDWSPPRESLRGRSEDDALSPSLKLLGLRIGQSLESYLRSVAYYEPLRFDRFVVRWTSAAIPAEAEPEIERPFAHRDPEDVYIKAVLTISGPGTYFWDVHPPGKDLENDDPAGQTAPGEILLLSGLRRAKILGRPELASRHAGPQLARESNRLTFHFYFDDQRLRRGRTKNDIR